MIFRRISALCLLFPIFLSVAAQESHMIRVFFRYGSIPVQGYEDSEYAEMGGMYGGHVSIGLDSLEIGFDHTKGVHLFNHERVRHSIFYSEPIRQFESEIKDKKYVTFFVPITDEQYDQLKGILQEYMKQTPYDYAFFGMRCASATYDVLSQIGLFPPLSRNKNIYSNFYPKLFRRKMFKLAKEKQYTIIRQRGRLTRIWDED